MRYFFAIILSIAFEIVSGQALQSVNFNYLYNPKEGVNCTIKPVHTASGWEVLYKLQLRDTARDISQYKVSFETRESLSDTGGKPLTGDSVMQAETRKARHERVGKISLASSVADIILVIKVADEPGTGSWTYYEILRPVYPVNGYLSRAEIEMPELSTSANVRDAYVINMAGSSPGTQVIVSHYIDNFPPGAPAFSESMAQVPKTMRVDSTFIVQCGAPVSFRQKGLFLVQKDTNSTEGFAFRAESDYPKYSKLENLVGPLIYVCAKQEFDKLKASTGDKKAFDKVILSITQDTERARTFMRSYFRRVEIANEYFTSYKEGWKTDRGMVYIVFGLPDEVIKYRDKEIWSYKNNQFRITFNFVRSSTLFDPENYVLVRDRKYQQTWYEVVDLWRNSRF